MAEETEKAFGHGVNQRNQINMTPEEIDAFLAQMEAALRPRPES